MKNLAHSFISVPAGKLSEKYSPLKVLLFGFLILILNNFWFYYSVNLTQLFVGIAFVGVHMGLTQGIIRSVIAENVPQDLRGSSYAFFYLVSGICVFLSNIFAGLVSDLWGGQFIFIFGALFSSLAFCALGILVYQKRSSLRSSEAISFRPS